MIQNHEKQAVTISSLLNSDNSDLKSLVKKAQAIHDLGQKLQSLVEPALKSRFTLANINNGVATLITDSSAWATRLRYNIPAILDILNNELKLKTVKTIRIKVKPSSLEKNAAHNNRFSISGTSADFLKLTAENIGDREIRDCLLKIAGEHSPQDD